MADGITFSLKPGAAAKSVRSVGITSSSTARGAKGVGLDTSHKGGIEYLARVLEKESKERRKCAHDILNKYALLIQGTARKMLKDDPRRVDEGLLRSSIQTFISQIFKQRLAALVFTDLEYAAFVHWGTGIHGENPAGGHRTTPWIYFDEKRREYYVTRGMEANMFLLNAFNKHAPQLERELKACLTG